MGSAACALLGFTTLAFAVHFAAALSGGTTRVILRREERANRSANAGASKTAGLSSTLVLPPISPLNKLDLAAGGCRCNEAGVSAENSTVQCGCSLFNTKELCQKNAWCDWVSSDYCADYVNEGCEWTLDYNCELQPDGEVGQAQRDGSVDYNCCCEAGLWQRLDICEEKADEFCKMGVYWTLYTGIEEDPEKYVERNGIIGISKESTFQVVHEHLFQARSWSSIHDKNGLYCSRPPCKEQYEEPWEFGVDKRRCRHPYVPPEGTPTTYYLVGSKDNIADGRYEIQESTINGHNHWKHWELDYELYSAGTAWRIQSGRQAVVPILYVPVVNDGSQQRPPQGLWKQWGSESGLSDKGEEESDVDMPCLQAHVASAPKSRPFALAWAKKKPAHTLFPAKHKNEAISGGVEETVEMAEKDPNYFGDPMPAYETAIIPEATSNVVGATVSAAGATVSAAGATSNVAGAPNNVARATSNAAGAQSNPAGVTVNVAGASSNKVGATSNESAASSNVVVPEQYAGAGTKRADEVIEQKNKMGEVSGIASGFQNVSGNVSGYERVGFGCCRHPLGVIPKLKKLNSSQSPKDCGNQCAALGCTFFDYNVKDQSCGAYFEKDLIPWPRNSDGQGVSKGKGKGNEQGGCPDGAKHFVTCYRKKPTNASHHKNQSVPKQESPSVMAFRRVGLGHCRLAHGLIPSETHKIRLKDYHDCGATCESASTCLFFDYDLNAGMCTTFRHKDLIAWPHGNTARNATCYQRLSAAQQEARDVLGVDDTVDSNNSATVQTDMYIHELDRLSAQVDVPLSRTKEFAENTSSRMQKNKQASADEKKEASSLEYVEEMFALSGSAALLVIIAMSCVMWVRRQPYNDQDTKQKVIEVPEGSGQGDQKPASADKRKATVPSKSDDEKKFEKALESNDLKAFVELLSSTQAAGRQAIASFEERVWAIPPKTPKTRNRGKRPEDAEYPWRNQGKSTEVGVLAGRQLAILASVAEMDNTDVKEDIRKAGAIPPLIEFLLSDQQDRVQASVVALSFLTAKCPDNAVATYNATAMPLLQRHLESKDASIRAAAATTIRNLCMEEISCHEAFVSSGGLKGFVAQLSANGDPALNPTVAQLEAVVNFKELIGDEDGTLIERYAELAVQAGAIEKLKALTTSGDDDVRNIVATLLTSLASFNK